ncbi:MAG: hypothetical protein WBQ85_03320 [Candidatus Sulfotelmatobacter sp.]
MGRLRFGRRLWIAVTISSFVYLSACGGHKPPGSSPFAARITISPATSYSMQAGTVIVFTATAQNAANSSLRTTFTFASSNPGVVDISSNGAACAGTWNAPLYTVCSPGGIGTAEITAESGGTTSAPTLVFVHPFIASIQVSIVPPVNSPPPACPTQTQLPAACTLPFKATNSCLSQNQILTLQANAFDSQGTDVTASVGPFTWSQGNASVATLTPIVTNNTYDVATNQANASANTPGQTQVIASASGVASQPFDFETCPVQCIALELNVSGSQSSNLTSFVVNKGTSETVTAYAVDVQGCIVPKPPLTWISSEPAALTAGNPTTGCGSNSTTCTISTAQPGVASISASCTPPSCNIGYPLNISGVPAPYVPQPVYPVTAISGLVTGAAAATGVLATSQDCYSNIQCQVGLYNVSTSTNLPGGASPLPTPPNSLMFDLPGDKAYAGSEFGAIAINASSLGSSASPFSYLSASGTQMGLVTGKIIAVSHNGTQAIFSDTVSTPNQVYLVGASSSALPLNINSATAAAFSPDGLETLILGDGGNTLYTYSALQYLQPPVALPTPASSIVFNSTGSFALLSGGSSPGTLAIYNTCDSSPVTPALSAGTISGPPIFLKMVPAGNVPMGNPTIPTLQTQGLDFFFGVDNTGIDIIATTSSLAPLTTLCPSQITLAQTPQNATFLPIHIDLGVGSFTPINFFLSPDSTKAYIVASDSSGILVYNFDTGSTSQIPLVNNATPLSADMTVDGSLIYVAGSDGMLHEVNTALSLDRMEVTFTALPNSSNSFCYDSPNCALNMIAIRP